VATHGHLTSLYLIIKGELFLLVQPFFRQFYPPTKPHITNFYLNRFAKDFIGLIYVVLLLVWSLTSPATAAKSIEFSSRVFHGGFHASREEGDQDNDG
jgi:hypothetical protein